VCFRVMSCCYRSVRLRTREHENTDGKMMAKTDLLHDDINVMSFCTSFSENNFNRNPRLSKNLA